MRSLKKDLNQKIFIAVLAILLPAGVILFVLIENYLLNSLDERLLSEARIVSGAVEVSSDGPELDLLELDLKDLNSKGSDDFLVLFYADGSIFLQTRGKMENTGIEQFKSKGNKNFGWYRKDKNEELRYLMMEFIPKRETESRDEKEASELQGKDNQAMYLLLARDASSVSNALNGILILFMVTGFVSIPVFYGMIILALKKGLRPLVDLSQKIDSLDESSLSNRIELEQTTQETQPIIEVVNNLLERLDQAFRREQQLSSDLAHELRTPLAALRAKLELALKRDRSETEYKIVIKDLQELALQLQKTIETMLFLARMENNPDSYTKEKIHLSQFINKHWDQFARQAETMKVNVIRNLDKNLSLECPPMLLSLAIKNIFENATAYVNTGGTIKIELSRLDDVTLLRVANTGSRVAAGEAQRVFDRFWRHDQSRGESQSHTGLGLPLVKKTLEILGGEVSVETEAGGEFKIEILFPESICEIT